MSSGDGGDAVLVAVRLPEVSEAELDASLAELGRLVGVVSATDVLRSEDTQEMTEGGYFATSLDRPLGEEELRSLVVEGAPSQVVGDVMTPVVFQIGADAPVDEAADTMARGRIHRIVVTEGGAVVGIVTALDLVRVLRDVLRQNR